jgi:hypothetical protein
MVLELYQASFNDGGGNGHTGAGQGRLQEEATDSLPPRPKPGILDHLKAKAQQVGKEVKKEATQVGKQLDQKAKQLNQQAKEHHVVDKVKKVAVAAGSHGLLGPAGAVAAEAVKEADKKKAKPHTDGQTQSSDAGHKPAPKKATPTHIDLTNPYEFIKQHIPKL